MQRQHTRGQEPAPCTGGKDPSYSEMGQGSCPTSLREARARVASLSPRRLRTVLPRTGAATFRPILAQ